MILKVKKKVLPLKKTIQILPKSKRLKTPKTKDSDKNKPENFC